VPRPGEPFTRSRRWLSLTLPGRRGFPALEARIRGVASSVSSLLPGSLSSCGIKGILTETQVFPVNEHDSDPEDSEFQLHSRVPEPSS